VVNKNLSGFAIR